jgi:voltage-gated potassium channel
MLSKLVIYCAYFLKSSVSYNRGKKFFYRLLEASDSRLRKYFDIFMIFLVMLSVSVLVYHVEHKITQVGEYLEQGVVLIFVAEYLLRGWLHSDSHLILIEEYEKAQYLNIRFSLIQALKQVIGKKLEYMFSPFAIIDLLAILPSYRPLRILRIFLIFRLFKLFRYSNSIKVFSDVLASKRFELITLMVFMGFLVFISSIAIYLFENQSVGGNVKDLYDAVYWSVVTISTVGYGDITPQTIGGRLVTMTLILTGLGVLSFFTSIVVSAFGEKMHTLRENRTYSELDRFKSFVIICGFGRVGQEVARQLDNDQQKFIIIDRSENNVMNAKQHGYLVVHDDVTKNDVLLNAGINRGATAVLCTTGNDVTNVYVTLSSRHLNSDILIISRANDHDNVKKLYQAGADNVIEPFAMAGMMAAEYLGQPVAIEAISGILQEQKHIQLETILITEDSMLENTHVSEIDFEQLRLVLIGVVSSNQLHLKHRNRYQLKHQHFYFNPASNFLLQAQDILVVMGREYSVDHFRDQIEQSRLLVRKV